jgi:anti-sigma B factor antagonist
MDMEVTELSDRAICIRLHGRLDAAGAEQIDGRFMAATAHAEDERHTLVDLAGVSFLASMGIRLLIASARGLNRKGAMMVLFGAADLVQDVIDLSALDQVIPVVANEALALERIGHP